ncbi:molybdopterin-dependent oxidoreductase [Desulfatiglans anilini]|uniref:molybdopterin-dependent oxidoreductase n=1 Tax=Desulfatiglans anilini TaxID=90728 RepID=UPI00040D935A|nr:molybdopterin-dependent oxidoreductase [Desulfatiglans anilini]
MQSIVLSINGKRVSGPPGASVLSIAEKNGFSIPTLCHHRDLAPYGACRMCLVEDEKTGRLMAACVTPAAQDMAVLTHSPRVMEHRRNIVRLMMAEHPESCIVCSKGNRCELRRLAAELGVGESGLYPMPNYKPFETLNPFIVRDLSKCILCGKCIRADHELVAAGAIDYYGRGFASRPATLHERPLESSRCTFCGTCVSLCPTGALSTRSGAFVGTPEHERNTVCGFCSAGCSLALGVSDGRVVEVHPSREPDTVNGVTLCVRGHFAHDFLSASDRLLHPLIRRKGEGGEDSLQQAAWDEALSLVGGRLAELKRRHGPESIAFLGSSKCSNEENYLLQKIARVCFRSPHVTSGGSLSGYALLRAVEDRLQGAGRLRPLAGLEQADAIVIVEADPDHTVPVAAYHIRRAARRGAPLVVVDPVRTGCCEIASAWLGRGGQPSLTVLNALTAELDNTRALDRTFIEARTAGWEDWAARFRALAPEKAAAEDPAFQDEMEKAVLLLRDRKLAFVIGHDLLERDQGPAVLDTVMNLALLTGSIGPRNAGIFVLGLENNLTGAFDMGAVPDLLPGRCRLEDTAARQRFETLWGSELPAGTGLDPGEIVEAALAGRLKALYIMGENPLRSMPDPERVGAALGRLEFLVVQDILMTRTARLAHVVLPGAAFAEKGGSFTNLEGRVQAFEPGVEPPGEALPDWTILAQLARSLGYPEHYATLEKIRQEIRTAIPAYAEIGSRRWGWVAPVETRESQGSNSVRFALAPPASWQPKALDTAFPYEALISAQRWHLGSGTRTSRSERIRDSGKHGEVELSPQDQAALALGAAGRVRVTSAAGSIERGFIVNRELPPGRLIIPQGFAGNDVMRLIGLERLKSPEGGWRTCPVRVEKA